MVSANGPGMAKEPQSTEIERFWNDFGPRFGTQNRPKFDYDFCCFFEPLKKRCSNDFDLQNDSKMEPISTTFWEQATMRFCCYLLYFRTILHLWRCPKSDLISMRIRRDPFLRMGLDFELFWGSLFDPVSSRFSNTENHNQQSVGKVIKKWKKWNLS